MRKAGLVVAITVLASGCATNEMRTDLQRLERSINDLRSVQAEQSDTISSLDSQVKAVSGRLEELEYAQNRRIGTDLSALKDDVTALRRRVPPPSIVPGAELEVDEVWAKSVQGEAGTLFTDALTRLREGNFADALPLLQNALEQTDGTDKAGVILYWTGVAYDGLSDNKGALRSYTESVSRYPQNQRAASSLLRQANVLERLGDRKTAALSLQKLAADYPRSPEARSARDRLRSDNDRG